MARNITNLNAYIVTRQCSIFHKGDSMPMKIDGEMASRGWLGGSFVRWVDDGSGDPCVTIADGRYCGFTPWGSNETADQYTSITPSQTRYKYITMFFGGNFMATTSFETYGYLARHGLGPMTPLVYAPQDFLYVSENGLITKEDESDPAVNPGHTFPNGDPIVVPFLYFGLCAVPPSTLTDGRMFVQSNVGV